MVFGSETSLFLYRFQIPFLLLGKMVKKIRLKLVHYISISLPGTAGVAGSHPEWHTSFEIDTVVFRCLIFMRDNFIRQPLRSNRLRKQRKCTRSRCLFIFCSKHQRRYGRISNNISLGTLNHFGIAGIRS